MVNGVEQVGKRPGEFDIIARYFAPLASDTAALGLKDDAAVLTVTAGHELVVTCDTIIEGVHFLKDDPPESVGHKALAVNLSDLTAKGARAYVYVLSIALPENISGEWLEGFAAGLKDLQGYSGISLIGGDTTASAGPLTITITALGLVTHQHAVMRLGAKPKDRLYLSGTIGDAYLGLRLRREPALAATWGLSEDDVEYLVDRYRRPVPNTELALLIRNFGQAAVDVSDGLVGDIAKLCGVSHVGAEIETARVPFSAAAQKALAREPNLLPVLITAGDDYGIVVAVSATSAADFESEIKAKEASFRAIGTIVEGGKGLRVLDGDGHPMELKHKGFSHF